MSASDPAIDWLVRDMRGHLRKRAKRFQLSDAGAYAHTLFETNTANLPTGHLACRAGCGGCCSSHVGVEVAEAFTLYRYLQDTLEPDRLDTVIARVADVAGQVGGLDAGARWEAEIPCAFLDPEAQACTVYAARPLACRGYNSTDLEACDLSTSKRDHSHPIPADGELMLRSQQLRHALGEVAARIVGASEPVEQMELHAAVKMAAEAGNELSWIRARKSG